MNTRQNVFGNGSANKFVLEQALPTSAKLMIDRLGQPPKEVCLDWAAQLMEHSRSIRIDSEADKATSDDHSNNSWECWLVQKDGSLHLNENVLPKNVALQQQIGDLLAWANKSDLDDAEQQLIRQLQIQATMLTPDRIAHAASSLSNSEPKAKHRKNELGQRSF